MTPRRGNSNGKAIDHETRQIHEHGKETWESGFGSGFFFVYFAYFVVLLMGNRGSTAWLLCRPGKET